MKRVNYFIILIIYLTLQLSCGNRAITYSNTIAPIIYKHCTPCHRPNQIGHFNLLTYQDAVSRKDAILYTVANKLMPPWPADVNYSKFCNEMVLQPADITAFKTWVKNNCPIGDSAAIPLVPNYPSKSFLGTPDLVVPIIPRQIKGNFEDEFLLIKVPFTIPEETYVHTIEFVPGNTKVVHHVNADLVRYDDAKKKNIFDGNWVYNSVNDSTVKNAYKQMGLLHDDGSYPTLHRNACNYLPGVLPTILPTGIGDIKLGKKNAFLLSDMHYGPSSTATADTSYFNLFFSKTPPQRLVNEFQLGTLGISPVLPNLVIEANTKKTVYSKYIVPETISIIMLNPHMHLLGTSFWGFAVKPNADTIPLIKIPTWNFAWQNFYKPITPIIVPAGSTIYAVGNYDNTEANPYNPYKPPRTISDADATMKTTDEMFQFIISYLEYKKGDEDLQLEAKE